MVPGFFALVLLALGASLDFLSGSLGSYLLLGASLAVVFLLLRTGKHEYGALALGWTAAVVTGVLIRGTNGGTLGALTFFLLALLAEGTVASIAVEILEEGSCLSPAVRGMRPKTTRLAELERHAWSRVVTAHALLTEGFLSEAVLRCLLIAAGCRPARWGRLLAYAEDALLIKRTGAEREFAHRLLRDYFALRGLSQALADPGRRAAAVRQLGSRGEAAIDTLGDCLRDPDPAVQAAAIEALKELGGDALPVLRKALSSCHDSVRSSARAAIDWIDPPFP
jgi:hypothetical protein